MFEVSRVVQGSFKGVLRVFGILNKCKRYFMEASILSQWCFKEDSKVSNKSFKGISREIEGGFKGVLNRFQGYLIEVQREFKGSLKGDSRMF